MVVTVIMSQKKQIKTKVDQAADVTGSIGLIPAVSHLSCGAALFIPVSHVFAFPARVLQSNLPPHSLPPTSSGNTYFLPPAPPCPPAVKTQRRGDGRVKGYVPRDLVNMQTLTSVCKVGPNYLVWASRKLQPMWNPVFYTHVINCRKTPTMTTLK